MSDTIVYSHYPTTEPDRELGKLSIAGNPPPYYSLSFADYADLEEQFSASPLTDGSWTPEKLKHYFLINVMNGIDVTDADPVGSQAYWNFNPPFSRDFMGPGGKLVPPDGTFEDTGEAGNPSNAFVPNLTAAPNGDPTQQPPPSKGMKNMAPKAQSHLVGQGSLLTPAVSSQKLAEKIAAGWSGANSAAGAGSYLKGNSQMTDTAESGV
tara:strand:- start:2448 stop:3074 length:627 start_codon:yes stop_codon:yes gene_type:complete